MRGPAHITALLFISILFASLTANATVARGGDDAFVPALTDIFSNPSTGVFKNTTNFIAFGLIFFIILFGVEKTMGPYWSENRWINVGVSFFLTAMVWSKGGSTMIKFADALGWFAIFGVLILIIASASQMKAEKWRTERQGDA